MKFTVGSNADNDLVINEPTVSGHHLDLVIDDEQVYHLTDVGSTNGTFINSRRVKTSTFIEEDILELGGHQVNTQEFFTKIKALYQQQKTDYSKEYQHTLSQFKDYQEEKDKINKRPITPIVIRTLPIIGSIVVVMLFSDYLPQWLSTSLTSIGLTLAIVVGYFASSPKKNQDKHDKLRLAYEDVLVCPKCKYKMITNSYTYWQGKKSCNNDRCDAIFKK